MPWTPAGDGERWKGGHTGRDSGLAQVADGHVRHQPTLLNLIRQHVEVIRHDGYASRERGIGVEGREGRSGKHAGGERRH